jgi:hypothetical protein
MNAYTKNDRQRRKVDREHFILYHWMFFRECRKWSPDDWMMRLRAEGLIAPSTYRLDCPSVTTLIISLRENP